MKFLQDEINRVLAKKLAKEVAYSAELAREFGFKIPHELEFGFSTTLRKTNINKYHYDISVRLLDVTHKWSMQIEDAALDNFIESCERESTNLIRRYIDAHPEVRPSLEEARKIAAQLTEEEEKNMDKRAAARALKAKLREA